MDKLVARRLIGPNRPPLIWCSLGLSKPQLLKQIRDFEPEEQKQTVEGWLRARYILKNRNFSGLLICWGLLHGLFSTIAIVIGLSRPNLRKEPIFRDACLLYLVYLLPYVLISHYMRYQVPLMGLSAYFLSAVLVQKKPSEKRE